MRFGVQLAGERLTHAILALAILLLGLAHMLVLPPFEGFDEIGHYASIRQVADSGTIPFMGESFMPQELQTYRENGPMPYALEPPFDQNNSVTYPAFFADQAKMDRYRGLYRDAAPRPAYTPTEVSNWQAQHPPAYYILLAGVMKLTDGMAFTTQFFALRLFSFLLAFAGLFIGLRGSLPYLEPSVRPYVMTAGLLYPLIVPMFVPEFGRLGNDSLCLLLMSVVWVLVLRWSQDEHDTKRNLALGFCLALGLLTKAFFLPVVAGFAAFVLLRLWRGRQDKRLVKERIDDMTVLFAPSLLGLGWYMIAWVSYGSFIGDGFTAKLAQKGGLWANLPESFSWKTFAHNLLIIPRSWVWAGTGSVVEPPRSLGAILLLVPFGLMLGYLRQMITRPWTDTALLPLWWLAPVLAGMIHHILVGLTMARFGSTDTAPGWYLSIWAPLFALMFAYAFSRIKRLSLWWSLLALLLAYNMIFMAYVLWGQIAVYAGCAGKGVDLTHIYPNSYLCLDQAALILDRLSVMGWPQLSLVCAVMGFVLMGWGVIRSLRSWPHAV